MLAAAPVDLRLEHEFVHRKRFVASIGVFDCRHLAYGETQEGKAAHRVDGDRKSRQVVAFALHQDMRSVRPAVDAVAETAVQRDDIGRNVIAEIDRGEIQLVAQQPEICLVARRAVEHGDQDIDILGGQLGKGFSLHDNLPGSPAATLASEW